MTEELVRELIDALFDIANELRKANDDPDKYDYKKTYWYDEPGYAESVVVLREKGWKIYQVVTDSASDLLYVMRKPREYGV